MLLSRVAHILFVVYFTLVSVGLLYNEHYCGERVSRTICGIGVDSEINCCCNHHSPQHDKGCCKSETKLLKADTQKLSAQAQFKIGMPFELNLFYGSLKELDFREFIGLNTIIAFDHPPPETSTPIFLLYKNLLI